MERDELASQINLCVRCKNVFTILSFLFGCAEKGNGQFPISYSVQEGWGGHEVRVIVFLLLVMVSVVFCLYTSGGGYAAIFRTVFVSIVLWKCEEQWLIAVFPAFSETRISMLNSL